MEEAHIAKQIEGAYARDMIAISGTGPAQWPRTLEEVHTCTVYPIPHDLGLPDDEAHALETFSATEINSLWPYKEA